MGVAAVSQTLASAVVFAGSPGLVTIFSALLAGHWLIKRIRSCNYLIGSIEWKQHCFVQATSALLIFKDAITIIYSSLLLAAFLLSMEKEARDIFANIPKAYMIIILAISCFIALINFISHWVSESHE